MLCCQNMTVLDNNEKSFPQFMLLFYQTAYTHSNPSLPPRVNTTYMRTFSNEIPLTISTSSRQPAITFESTIFVAD